MAFGESDERFYREVRESIYSTDDKWPRRLASVSGLLQILAFVWPCGWLGAMVLLQDKYGQVLALAPYLPGLMWFVAVSVGVAGAVVLWSLSALCAWASQADL